MTLNDFITMLNTMREQHSGDIPIYLKTKSRNLFLENHPEKLTFVEEMDCIKSANLQVSRYFDLTWLV